jgi:hypothetical protein
VTPPDAPSWRDPALEATERLLLHERLEGLGEVFDGERLIADVEYALKDVEEPHGRSSHPEDAPPATRPQRNIYGVVKPRAANALTPYVGERLTLRLQDGRRLPFTVAKVMGTFRYLLQGLGDFR